MSLLHELSCYLEAKREYEEYEVPSGEYSQWKWRLYDKMDDAGKAFEDALERLIADRIESATGARP